MFWVDIALNLRTAHYDARRTLVTGRGAVAARYVRRWLALDAVASLPWDVVVAAATGHMGRGAAGRVSSCGEYACGGIR